MKLFIYHLALKPEYHDASAWSANVQEALNQHGDFLNRGVQHGRVMMVGRTETELRDNFGVVIYEAENQADADEFMNADPAIARGIMMGRAFPFKMLKVTEQAKKWSAW